MWFCQSLSQVEPLLVVAALIAAFTPSIYSSTTISREDQEFISPLAQKAVSAMFVVVTPLSLLAAILAVSYGWFAGIKCLAAISLVCVSLSLLLIFLVVVITLVELRVLRFRNMAFLPQFDEDWGKDLEDIREVNNDSRKKPLPLP